MPDFKKEAARAALQFIEKDACIGFGAGSTVKHVIDYIKEDKQLAGSIVTLSSSYTTKKLLQQYGFTIQDVSDTGHIDLYLDGCDQFDGNLNALKSGGGIHTMEKLLAGMATQFIILGDESKYVEKLDARFPLVLEIIPQAISFVLQQLKKIFSSITIEIRSGDKRDGAVITEHGNFLIDVLFSKMPEPEFINLKVSGITGVLEHSLFYNLANKAVISGPAGTRVITKPG